FEKGRLGLPSAMTPSDDNALSRRDFTHLLGAAALTPMLAGVSSPPPDDITAMSATELAARIRRKDLSAREVLDAHLTRIDRVNPRVNAIVTLVPEMARNWAKAADERQARGESLGPLHGLPVAHKDLVDTAGIR